MGDHALAGRALGRPQRGFEPLNLMIGAISASQGWRGILPEQRARAHFEPIPGYFFL
jgi:hypothetical protein